MAARRSANFLTAQDTVELGELALRHDLWILADEVYDELVFGGEAFHSPLSWPDLSDRVIVVSSISKSHAAPGFRSGWCVGPAQFCSQLLPLTEAMLFGNQPFIADATARAIAAPSPVARGMCERLTRRADRLERQIRSQTPLRVHKPEAGMFALIDVSATGLDGEVFARDLLMRGGVGVMPGSSFGETLRNWVRISLTASDTDFNEAISRIISHVNALPSG